MGLVVELLLFAAAWLGHAFLLTVVLNVAYAMPVRRWVLKRLRELIALLVFTFPIVFICAFWRHFQLTPPAWSGELWERAALVYLLVCCFVALLYLPIISVIRARRSDPIQVTKSLSRVIDVALALGEKPIGNGENWRMASLPGNQCFQVEFRELTLGLPRLPPAWEGLSILHLTDIHLCGTPSRPFYRHIFDQCLKAGVPDILAITGDIVDSFEHHRWVIPLLGRLRWNVAAFAILGNHDGYHHPELVRRRLRRLKIHVLGNAWEQVEVRGEPLVVIGQESPWFRPGPDLSRCPVGPFRLCLSHTPDYFGWARRGKVDLMLAGHVHGGQIRIPPLGPIFVPSRYSRRFDCGAFYANPTFLYVSRGLAGREPLRYNCRPEVTRIVLTSRSPQGG